MYMCMYMCIILNEIDMNPFSNYKKEIIEFYFKSLIIHFIINSFHLFKIIIHHIIYILLYVFIHKLLLHNPKIINFILFDNLKKIQKIKITKDFVEIIAENFKTIIQFDLIHMLI